MGRFYGQRYSAYGLPVIGKTLVTATVPVVRTDALVPPESMPAAPSTDPSAPAGFAPYQIRPELIGAPVTKGIVPGMFDASSLMSLFPSLTAGSSVAPLPAPPQPVSPVSAPAPVKDIFNTHVAVKAAQAIELNQAAQVHADVASDLQRKADAAAFTADQAASHATMTPTFDAQAAAAAAAARATIAQGKADTAASKAVQVSKQADASAANAQQAFDTLAQTQDAHIQANEQAVQQADAASIDQLLSTPGQLLPPGATQQVMVPGFSVSPVVAAGGLGALGFFLGGIRGGVVGTLLGGVAAYFMGQRQSAYVAPAQQHGAITGGLLPMPSGGAYVGESFVPYQMPDGTWITSAQDEANYYSAHVN